MNDTVTSVLLNSVTSVLLGGLFLYMAKQTWFFKHPLGRIITPVLVTFLGSYYLLEAMGGISYIMDWQFGMILSAYGRMFVKLGVVWTAINMKRKFA